MGKETKISWTHHTFNTHWGCAKVSPGCTNCYAAAFDNRLGGKHWELKGPRRFFGAKHWAEPLKWNKAAKLAGERRRVFCSSMADVFEDRPDLEPVRLRLWDLILSTPHLDWLLLTKRPENFHMLPWGKHGAFSEPFRNVWLGVTAENQEYADIRVPLLLNTSAVVRFLSCEPLLGPVDLRRVRPRRSLAAPALVARPPSMPIDSLTGGWGVSGNDDAHHRQEPRIHLVIAGCESGHGARTCDVEWIRSLRDQCAVADVPFFLKQAFEATDLGQGMTDGAAVIGLGLGSNEKARGLIELPYLDGVQHAAMPEVNHG